MEVRYVERPCLEINGGGANCGSELSVRQIVSVHSFRNVAMGNTLVKRDWKEFNPAF